MEREGFKIKQIVTLGKAIKADVDKLKQLKKLKKPQSIEERECMRSIEFILDNAFDLLSKEDQQTFLKRKLKETQSEGISPKQAIVYLRSSFSVETESKLSPVKEPAVAEQNQVPHYEGAFDMISPVSNKIWYKIGEDFKDVSISHDGIFWAIGGKESNYAGHGIFYYYNGNWNSIEGEAVKIAAWKAGEVWAVNRLGRVFQRIDEKWIMRGDNNTATDIAVGADGSVWIICGSMFKDKGINIMYFDFLQEKFVKSVGYGNQISVTSTGQPIVVLENGEIVWMKSQQIEESVRVNGMARSINVSKNDVLWIVGQDKVDGIELGYPLFKSISSLGDINENWEMMPVGAVKVAAADDETVIIVNELGHVYSTKK